MSSENNNQPSRLKLSIAFVICSLFIAGVVGYKDYISYKSQLNFVVDIQASQPGVSQVFFDVGHGDNEQDSYSIRIQGANPQLCIFPLPIQTIKSFRFDPINVAAVVKIKEARIENNQGDIIKKFPVQSFRPIQQISKMDIADGTLIIHTVENANDPIIGIENSSLEISLIKNQVSWGGYLIKQGWKYFGYCLLSLLFFSGLFYFVIDARRTAVLFRLDLSVLFVISIYFVLAMKIVVAGGGEAQDFNYHLSNAHKVLDGSLLVKGNTNPPLTYIISSGFFYVFGDAFGLKIYGFFCVIVNCFGLYFLWMISSKFLSKYTCLLYILFIATLPFFVTTSVAFASDALTFLPFYLYCYLALLVDKEIRINKIFILSSLICAVQLIGGFNKYTFMSLGLHAALLITIIGVRQKLNIKILAALILIASIIPTISILSLYRYADVGRIHSLSTNNLKSESIRDIFMPRSEDIKLFDAPMYFKPIKKDGVHINVDFNGNPYKNGWLGYEILVNYRHSYFGLLNLALFTDVMNITKMRFHGINKFTVANYEEIRLSNNILQKVSFFNGFIITFLTFYAFVFFFIDLVINYFILNTIGTFKSNNISLLKNIFVPCFLYFIIIVGLIPFLKSEEMYYGGYWLPRLVGPSIVLFFLVYFWLLDKISFMPTFKNIMFCLVLYQICIQIFIYF